MIGNETHVFPGNFPARVFQLFFYGSDYRHEKIRFKIRFRSLRYRSDTLQPHTGINILVRQTFQGTIAFSVKFGEHEIPHFQEPAAVTCGIAGGLSASGIRAVIVEYFGTGAARPVGAVFRSVRGPEIIVSAEFDYFFSRNFYFLEPDRVGFFILLINRYPQSFPRKAHHLCHEFPRPQNGLFFKIITERKISEHLKKSMMPGSFSHVINIGCSQAFLARRRFFGSNVLPHELFLELVHAGAREKKRWIVCRNQRIAPNNRVPLLTEKPEKLLSYLVRCHGCFTAVYPLGNRRVDDRFFLTSLSI